MLLANQTNGFNAYSHVPGHYQVYISNYVIPGVFSKEEALDVVSSLNEIVETKIIAANQSEVAANKQS